MVSELHVRINLKDFLVTGRFGRVSFGVSRRELELAFGEPEAYGGVSRKHRRPTIWKYGDVEFFFPRTGDAGLQMVHIDRFSGADHTPQGWGELQIEPWVIREAMSLAEFVDAIERAGISYTVCPGFDWNQKIIAVASGVEIGFVCAPDEVSDFVGLGWVSRKADIVKPIS